ncbi:hypothetical protein ACFQL7_21270 [Halocatena marina]|uniref:Uncharacterized protein n=1 Tax=Halocatena marina TaxID=2934937 RepID=A0ABD5YS57_9EURY
MARRQGEIVEPSILLHLGEAGIFQHVQMLRPAANETSWGSARPPTFLGLLAA